MNAAAEEAIGAVIGLIVGGVLLTAWNRLADRPQRRYYRAYWDAELARARQDEQEFHALLAAYGWRLDADAVTRVEAHDDNEEA